jgi:hypothetical protein
MLVETTYDNKEDKDIVNDLVGKPFSILQSLKMNGTGSKRMIVEEVSPNMNLLINSVSDINYANIELRPKGIVIRINKGLRNFAWAIPFYHLVMYKINGSSIHAQGRFIHFKNNKTFKENKPFFDKLMDQKIKYDMQYDFQYTL